MTAASIIIPAHDQQDKLDRSLNTLAEQTVSPAEIIVVDDGSWKPLTVPHWVKLHRIEREATHRGSSAAKNIGARLATQPLLIFMDSDILLMPDAVESLTTCYNDWGSRNLLLNVARASLPQHYPEHWLSNMETLWLNVRTAGIAFDPDMTVAVCCWEQNFAAIDRDYFWSLGGYDEDSFQSWGFNNQDLDISVLMDGGQVSSNVMRLADGLRLHCFHQWHDAPRGKEQAESEWLAKWGAPWSEDFVRQMGMQKRLHGIDEWRERIYRRAA